MIPHPGRQRRGSAPTERAQQRDQRTVALRLERLDRTSAEFEAVTNDLHDYLARRRGRVVVAALPSLAALTLPPALARLKALHPGIEIALRDTLHDEIQDLVESGSADFGLTVAPSPARGLAFEPLLVDRFVMVCRPDHPLANRRSVTWERMLRHPIITMSRTSSVRQHLDAACAHAGISIVRRTGRSPSVAAQALLELLGASPSSGPLNAPSFDSLYSRVRSRGRVLAPPFSPPHTMSDRPDDRSDLARPHAVSTSWVMLLALTGGFALSQAYRTVAAIMAPQLQAEFSLSPQALGIFAATFHFAFGALQLLMGIGMDLYGVRRTVLVAFPLAIAGSVLSAVTDRFGVLLVGQALIGIGCAPAFLACTVFIAQRFPPARYASVSGLVLGLGGIGMLATGTPLAWLIEASSWRAGFVALTALSVLAWLAIARFVREPATRPGERAERESLGQALRGFASLVAMPHTWGILALAVVSYAAFVSLRGLWLGPLLVDSYGLSLVASGNVAVAVSIASMIGPPFFGHLDPGRETRRRWLLVCTLVSAVLFALLAGGFGATFDIIVSIVYSLLFGYGVLQYADVRDAYPASMTGRALSLFTMALFLGVALMQWLTGAAATAAVAAGLPPFGAAFGAIALMLAAGALLFAWLPQPQGSGAAIPSLRRPAR